MGNRAELRQKQAQQKRNTTLAVVAGLGFIFLAVIAFMALPGLTAGGNSGQSGLSTIPVEVNYQGPCACA